MSLNVFHYFINHFVNELFGPFALSSLNFFFFLIYKNPWGPLCKKFKYRPESPTSALPSPKGILGYLPSVFSCSSTMMEFGFVCCTYCIPTCFFSLRTVLKIFPRHYVCCSFGISLQFFPAAGTTTFVRAELYLIAWICLLTNTHLLSCCKQCWDEYSCMHQPFV